MINDKNDKRQNNTSFEKNDDAQVNLAIIREDTMVKRENNEKE